MILLIDTSKEQIGRELTEELNKNGKEGSYEYIDTTDMNISHCLGCNYCWLKTPGKCVIKDDYDEILKKMSKADQVWLISDTRFGFVSYKAKNIIDRIMPLVTMNLHVKGKQMRHVMRYDHNPDFGLIYAGEGNKDHLDEWCSRVAINFGTKSVGVFDTVHMKEAIRCM